MKRDRQLDIEFTTIIQKAYSKIDEPLPIKTGIDECNFVVYNVNESEESAAKDPLRHLYFARNHTDSKEANFLDEAKYLLDLTIETFELIIAKYGIDQYPQIQTSLIKLQSASEEFERLGGLDKPLSDVVPTPGQPLTLYFGYQLLPGQEKYDRSVYTAICDFFLIVYVPYGSFQSAPAANVSESAGDLEIRNLNSLFANSKQINASNNFGIPKSVSDGLNRVIKSVSRDGAMTQYKDSNRTPRFVSPGENPVSLDLDTTSLSIKAAEQFATQLMRIKDAKILQTFCAIWKFANTQDSYVFRNVPISELMKIVLKENEKTNFTVENRRNFTEALNYLSALTITLQVQAERTNKKGKKQTYLQEEKGVRLFRLIAEYSLKKAFQKLPKDQLTDEHFDKTVISKFSGELLPGYNRNFTGRASIYSDVLLQLDANKDQRAVVLGFMLQTRFNQLQDKEKSIQMERGYLIDQCDYQKSDLAKPAVATKQLKNVLEKLKATGIISRYENLTNNNADKVTIYPPKVLTNLAIA